MFSNLSNNQPKPGGLFNLSTPASQPQTQQKPTLSLFGNTSTQQPAAGTSNLFGNTTTQQQPAAANPFGSSAAKPFSWGSTTQNQPQTQAQQQPTFEQSFFSGSTTSQPLPRLGQSQWTPARSSVREKSIPQQMQELLGKWHPNSPDCVFQHYFYRNVGPDNAPFFGVPEGEDARKWEEALQNKPDDGSIPVLAKGFGDQGLASRIKVQQHVINSLYQRVYEIDGSLRKRIEDHDLKFTVRTQEARRKHIALSRRCLALATKVQVLRNRGYALDSGEEELKEKLKALEKTTFDPVITGRQEELWARMTVVRERAKMLKDETERLGKTIGPQDEETIDEETMTKIKDILTQYDSQLAHLRKELEMVQKDFSEWEVDTKPASSSKR